MDWTKHLTGGAADRTWRRIQHRRTAQPGTGLAVGLLIAILLWAGLGALAWWLL